MIDNPAHIIACQPPFVTGRSHIPASTPIIRVSLTPELSTSQSKEWTALDGPEPLAMIRGDRDEDAFPGLPVSCVFGNCSYRVLHRGDFDAIFPYSPDARRRRESGVGCDLPFHKRC